MGYEESFKKVISYSFLAFTLTAGGIYTAKQISKPQDKPRSELERKLNLETDKAKEMRSCRSTLVEMHSYFNP